MSATHEPTRDMPAWDADELTHLYVCVHCGAIIYRDLTSPHRGIYRGATGSTFCPTDTPNFSGAIPLEIPENETVFVNGGAWVADPDNKVFDTFTHPVTGDELIICDETDDYPEPFEPFAGEWVEGVPEWIWVSTVCEMDQCGRPYWQTMRKQG